MELSVIILAAYLISVTFFLVLLIILTLEDSHKLRLVIKTITCFHFLACALLAVLLKKVEASEMMLVFGLCASFLGDVALGFKYKDRSFLIWGTMLFMLGQVCYILFFGIVPTSIWLSLPLFAIALMFGYTAGANKQYDFKGMGWAVNIYGLVLILMVSSALASWVLHPTQQSSMRVIGGIFFFFSDFILLHLYFYKKRNNVSVVVYLVLYHIAQSLIAWSLW